MTHIQADRRTDIQTDMVKYRVAITVENVYLTKLIVFAFFNILLNMTKLLYFLSYVCALLILTHKTVSMYCALLQSPEIDENFILYLRSLYTYTHTQNCHIATLSFRGFQSKIINKFDPALSFKIVV